jgi:two-component system sensor kinase FixL
MAIDRTQPWHDPSDEEPGDGQVAGWVRQQERAAELWRASLEGKGLDALLLMGVRELADELGADHVELRATVASDHQSGGAVELDAGVGWLRQRFDVGMITELMASQVALTLAAREPILSANLSTEKRFRVLPRLLDCGAVTSLSVLIRAQSQPAGVIIAYRRGRHAREFSRADLSFARGVANVLAAAIRSDASDRALRAGAERMRAVLDTVVDGIVTIDEMGTIESINPAACKLFGYQREELIGSNVKLLMPEPYHSEHDEYLKKYRETGVARIIGAGREMTGRRRDGSTFPLHLGISAFVLGKRRMFAGVLRDLTEQKRLEREILAIGVNEQRRIGHDLHNGVCQELAGVTFALEVLGRKLADRSAPEAAGVRQVEKLVEQAIAHARTLAHGLQPVTLDAAGLTAALRDLATKLETTFHVSCLFVSQSEVLVHDNQIATHMFRIAQEAVGNAIKHGKAKTILMDLSAEDDCLRMTVTDDGIALVKSSREDGRGIGLKTMAYRARVVGGRAEVRAGEHGGTVVTCVVPLRGPPDAAGQSDKGAPLKESRSQNNVDVRQPPHAVERGRRRSAGEKDEGRRRKDESGEGRISGVL